MRAAIDLDPVLQLRYGVLYQSHRSKKPVLVAAFDTAKARDAYLMQHRIADRKLNR